MAVETARVLGMGTLIQVLPAQFRFFISHRHTHQQIEAQTQHKTNTTHGTFIQGPAGLPMLGEGGKVPDALPEKFGALIVPSCGFAQVCSSSPVCCVPLSAPSV